MRGNLHSLILNHIEFFHIHVFYQIIKAMMCHFLHSLKEILLAYLRSNSLILVSNKLKTSLMVANNTVVQTITFEPVYREK